LYEFFMVMTLCKSVVATGAGQKQKVSSAN